MQIVAPDPLVTIHAHAFDEVLRVLVAGLARNGVPSRLTTAPELSGEPMLVIAPHRQTIADLDALPRDTILYSWEPLGDHGSRAMRPDLIAMMSEFVIWDYSEKNVACWKAFGAQRVVHVPLGYDPSIVSLTPNMPQPDLDVLFYGCVNERRAEVLNDIRRRGATLGSMFGGFGLERDAAISRSRLIVNLHFYDTGILELPRMSYLWANRKPVISEVNAGTEVPFGMRDHMLSAPYEGLADAVLAALENPAALTAAAEDSFQHFSANADAAAILERALSETAALGEVQAAPKPTRNRAGFAPRNGRRTAGPNRLVRG